MIKVLEVSKTYRGKLGQGPDVRALDRVSFTLDNKGLVFVLGRSGGGKSTLLNLLGGLDTIDSGDISVNGTLLASLDGSGLDSYRNSYVGFVFQEYNLLEGKTVKENVSLALSLQGKKDDSLVDWALNKVSMFELASRKASTLSGGQKQRVAIARAIVKKPALLLADEPTGALDSETGTQIMGLLKEISVDRPVVVVSHDQSFAEKYADRIIKIDDGRVVSDSNPVASEDSTKPLPLIKSRMRLNDSAYMAVRSLRAKVSRLVLTSLLSVISFSVFGVASAASSWDQNKATLNSIDEADNKSVSITCFENNEPVLISGSKINEIKEAFKGKIFIKECVGTDTYGNEVADYNNCDRTNSGSYQPVDYPDLGDYYSNKIYGFAHFTLDDIATSGFELTGRLPESDDEIAISDYSYRYLKKADGIYNYKELIANLDICGLVNRSYKIVGVVDTHFSSKKYDDKNLNLYSGGGVEYRDFLLDELRNSFNSSVFLNESMYEFVKSRDDKNISMSNGEVSISFEKGTIADGLEEIYEGFIKTKEKQYYIDNHRYYDVDDNTGTIRLTNAWFEANGYEFNSNNGTYTKTISDPDGDYQVTYDSIGNRISEKEDPTLNVPERVSIIVPRREFIDAQIVTATEDEKHSLLLDENTFASLNDDEIIAVVDSKLSPFYEDYVNGKKEFSLVSGQEVEKVKVRALCMKNDASNNAVVDFNLATSKSTKTSLLEKASGSYRLIANLSNDRAVNHEFFDYLTKAKLNGASFKVSNISESAIREIDSVLSGPTLTIAFSTSIVLAVFSSLILMNFIGISMSYGKKEMGILRALGASNKDVLFVYLLEGLIIALANGAIAFGGALLACSIINSQIASYFAVSVEALSFSALVPLIIFGLSILSSLLAVSLPIWKNRNKKPIETLTNR